MMIPKSKRELIDFALTASFLYAARTIPNKLWTFAQNKLYTKVILDGKKHELVIYQIKEFLSNKDKFSENYSYSIKTYSNLIQFNKIQPILTSMKLEPGIGSFKFKYKNVTILCETYIVTDDKVNIEYLTLKILTKNKHILDDMLEEISAQSNKPEEAILINLSMIDHWRFYAEKKNEI